MRRQERDCDFPPQPAVLTATASGDEFSRFTILMNVRGRSLSLPPFLQLASSLLETMSKGRGI